MFERIRTARGNIIESLVNDTVRCPKCESQQTIQNVGDYFGLKDKLVHIVYRDHLLFRNNDSKACYPAIRETVGWVIAVNAVAVWVLWDRTLEKSSEVFDEQSGLVIIKNCIIQLRVVSFSEVPEMHLSRGNAQQASQNQENRNG